MEQPSSEATRPTTISVAHGRGMCRGVFHWRGSRSTMSDLQLVPLPQKNGIRGAKFLGYADVAKKKVAAPPTKFKTWTIVHVPTVGTQLAS